MGWLFSPQMWKIFGLPGASRANVARMTALCTFQIFLQKSVFIPAYNYFQIHVCVGDIISNIFIDGEAREIMYLVASVCLSVCPFVCALMAEPFDVRP